MSDEDAGLSKEISFWREAAKYWMAEHFVVKKEVEKLRKELADKVHEVAALFRRPPLGVEADLGLGPGDSDQDPAPALEDELETIPAVHLGDLESVDLGPRLCEALLVDALGPLGEWYLGAAEKVGSHPGREFLLSMISTSSSSDSG